MQFIFDVIVEFSYERRRLLIVRFLDHNKNFKAFEKIPLERSVWGWSGSAVPMYQRLVEYFESLLTFVNTVDLLQHRQYIEQHIRKYREIIEREKKKDFMED